jgi:hypothetical protein
VKCEVMAAMLLRHQIFCDVTVCQWACGSQHCFETLGTPHSMTHHHIPEDKNSHDKCALFPRSHMPILRCDTGSGAIHFKVFNKKKTPFSEKW